MQEVENANGSLSVAAENQAEENELLQDQEVADQSDLLQQQEDLNDPYEDPEDEATELLMEALVEDTPFPDEALASVKAVIEAAIYITDEPLTAEQIAIAVEQPIDRVKEILAKLVEEYAALDRGLFVRELAGGYKMGTKPEHHDSIRKFVKNLKPPLKLSLAALETLAVIAYKQPITAPEIMDIRGVQGAGVLKTLLDRKLIATGGRKDVLGKPIMYKTTREFLIQFGLSSVNELPTLKEFEELGRLALDDASLEQPSAGLNSEVREAAAESTESEYAAEAEAIDSEITEPESAPAISESIDAEAQEEPKSDA